MNGIKIEEALLKFKEQLVGLKDEKDFYQYEEQFIKFWQEAGRQVFESSISKNLEVKKSKKKR